MLAEGEALGLCEKIEVLHLTGMARMRDGCSSGVPPVVFAGKSSMSEPRVDLSTGLQPLKSPNWVLGLPVNCGDELVHAACQGWQKTYQ